MEKTETQKSTTDYLISLMMLHAENQGLSKNYVCEQTGVDLRKYKEKGHRPSLKTIECYCLLLKISAASLIMIAELAYKKQVADTELTKWVENWQRFQEAFNVCFELQLRQL